MYRGRLPDGTDIAVKVSSHVGLSILHEPLALCSGLHAKQGITAYALLAQN